MEDEQVDIIIKEYFNEEEWENLADICKIRYRNMYRNYISIPGAESFMPLPDFMQKSKNKAKNQVPTDTNNNKCVTNNDKKTERKILKRKLNDKAEQRYPKRAIAKVNYHEEEEPNQDRYVYCDNCDQEYLDFCTKCGMLIALYDFPVPLGTNDRARKTVPKGILEVRPSSIHGCGVFAVRNIRKGIQMGPYQGKITRLDTTNGYAWKLRNGRLIDAGDETVSNWMRYVNCARSVAEQNLVAFQYNGQLYYRTCRNIEKDEELLVYYGQSFAKILGIDTKKYFQPNKEEISKDYYVCVYCRIGLSTGEYRDKHQMRCVFRPGYGVIVIQESHPCRHCLSLLTTKEYLEKHEKNCPKRPKKIQISEEGDKGDAIAKEFRCQHCSYSTKWKYYLNQHTLAIHHKDKSKLCYCDKCSFRSYYKQALSKHLRTHGTHRYLFCKECSKGFNEKKQLDNHYLQKHEDSNYIITSKIHHCEYCDYKSSIVQNLKNHLISHHSKKSAHKYHCNQCSFSSVWKRSIQEHILSIHSNKKKYVCIACEKGFNEKKEMDSHILSRHSQEADLLKTITSKIHSCQICSYKTVVSSNFKRHTKSHNKK